MKIAIAQIDMGFEDKEKAMELCVQQVTVAAAHTADFIVFPEMTLTGFTMNPQAFGEEREDSKTTAFFQEQALKNQIAICFGLPIYENNIATNSCLIIDENGVILADYSKIHLFFGAETKRYTNGNNIQFCKIKGVALSPFICYDLRFPEPFQIASAQSQIITVIANWPETRRDHWMTLLKARAIENQCFFIGVNRCGKDKKLSYCGDSMAISPTGEVIAYAGDSCGLTIVEINPSEVELLRNNFPQKNDRRPILYKSFYETD